MDKKTLEQIKEKLLSEKQELTKELNSFADKNNKVDNEYETKFPNYGEHEDDNASEVADFESDLYLEKTLEQSLRKIDEALERIEKGTYGSCEECGKKIPTERCLAFPTAAKCMECKRKSL
jgi:RNA polymerase-binding protein DksA